MGRLQPVAPPSAYQTYSITSPPDRTIVTACEQAGCEAWRYGWDTPVDEATDLGREQAAYIRARSGRTFRELARADGVTVFRFEAKQRCFAEHRTRPEIYRVRGGDWRQTLGAVHTHTSPADWVEDMGEHLHTINDQRKRG